MIVRSRNNKLQLAGSSSRYCINSKNSDEAPQQRLEKGFAINHTLLTSQNAIDTYTCQLEFFPSLNKIEKSVCHGAGGAA